MIAISLYLLNLISIIFLSCSIPALWKKYLSSSLTRYRKILYRLLSLFLNGISLLLSLYCWNSAGAII